MEEQKHAGGRPSKYKKKFWEEIYIDNMVAEDGSLLLPVAYFKEVQQDYHVVVE